MLCVSDVNCREGAKFHIWIERKLRKENEHPWKIRAQQIFFAENFHNIFDKEHEATIFKSQKIKQQLLTIAFYVCL